MRNTHFCLVLVALLFAFASCKQADSQMLTPNPKIRMIPGGIEITPELTAKKEALEKIKSVRLTAQSLGERKLKPIEKEILMNQPYRLVMPGSFSYQLTYLDGNNQTLGISSQTLAATDSMTWDVVVGLALPGSVANGCNCTAQNTVVNFDLTYPNERNISWGPSTSTNQDIRRITVTNPSTGVSAVTLAIMNADGTLSLATRSGTSLPCLTEGGFSLSSDSRLVTYSAGGLFFSLRSRYDSSTLSSTQTMTIFCPAGYTVTVEKLTCT